MLPSANVPVAMKATPVCAAMLAIEGESFIDASWGLTKIVLLPVTAPNCAEITAFPPASAVTVPPLSTEATAVSDELQLAIFVITSVVPSLRVAVATQSKKVRTAISAVAGVTEIEEIVAVETVSGAEPETPLKVAEMLAVPGLTAVAVFEAPIVATAGLSELHVESFVMSWKVLSLNRPAAVKSKVVPTAMLCPDGVTLIDTIVAFVTLNVVEAVIAPRVAVTVVVPAVRPLDSPVLMIWSTAVLEDAQVTWRVTF